MADIASLKQKVTTLVDNVKYYWKEPPKGRYMSFKEIGSYAFGGIGAYLIVSMSYICMLATTNVFITGTIGITPTDMYILYVIATVASIPLTGLRATIVDNTRNKAGKYRPYILMMGIPSAILFIAMVWFPYDKLSLLVGTNVLFAGKTADYLAKCFVLLLFNVILQFVYMFFYDAYENLIHVLSPNSQERADVASIKSIVYSLGPSVVNLIMPIVAENVFHTNQTDIRVYRLVFPILGILGSALLVIVYANTKEKIIQAKTHVIQIKFTDAFKAVAKNKYFWIISLASWIGFLELAYSNILAWLYNYGGACSGNVYGIIVTLNGNYALWGMIMAPFFIRKYGKKNVQIVTNLLNIVFILAMILFTGKITSATIWMVLLCLYCNGIVGAFAHILNPAIQADIRDYQQYRTGERIDGMFSTVGLIGTVITLLTSGLVPAVYEKVGINENTLSSRASEISAITGKSISEVMNSPYNVLYINDIFKKAFVVIVILSVIGATLNFIPYFFYDMTELRQRAIVKVLKLRAMFEDYGNGVLSDKDIVDAIDVIEEAQSMKNAEPKDIDSFKKAVKSANGKAAKKQAKKALKDAIAYNENIEISKMVNEEVEKFDREEWKLRLEEAKRIYANGIDGLSDVSDEELERAMANAKAMPKDTKKHREERSAAIETARNRKYSKKAIAKAGGKIVPFDNAVFEQLFAKEDANLAALTELETEISKAKKAKDKNAESKLKAKKAKLKAERKEIEALIKKATDENSYYNRLAKPYIDAGKLIVQAENYKHYEDIKAMYDDAKARDEENRRLEEQKAKELEAKQKEMKQQLKTEKAKKKREQKNK